MEMTPEELNHHEVMKLAGSLPNFGYSGYGSDPKNMDFSSDKLVFGYWGVKNIGEPIRWLIRYLKMDHEEYNPQTQEEWYGKRKFYLGLDFPNLPYVIDGNIKITESKAIPHYLVHKAGQPDLLGKNPLDRAHVNMIENMLDDVKKAFMKVVYVRDNHKSAMQRLLHSKNPILKKFCQLSTYLGSKEYFLGYLTVVDITVAYTIELIGSVVLSLDLPNMFKQWKNLMTHMHRIQKLPGINERFETSMDVPYLSPALVPFPLLTTAQIKLKNLGGFYLEDFSGDEPGDHTSIAGQPTPILPKPSTVGSGPEGGSYQETVKQGIYIKPNKMIGIGYNF